LALLSQRSRWSLAATRKPLLRPLLPLLLRPLTLPLRLLHLLVTPPLRLLLRLVTPLPRPLRLLLRRTDPFRI